MKKWIPTISALTMVVLAVSLTGCGQKKDDNTEVAIPAATDTASGKLQIEASFYPMYEFASQVAGDLADIHLLIPASVEPHDWEPTPQDIGKIEQADILVYNGGGLEGWVEQVLASSTSSKLSAVEASKGLELMEGTEDHEHEGEEAHDHHDEISANKDEHDHHDEVSANKDEHDHRDEAGTNQDAGAQQDDHDHGGLDPHVWLSPKLAIQEVRNIEAALIAKAPEHKDEFTKNADAYVAKLEQLDDDYRKALENTKRKDFITQHTAFGYLAKTYGLTQVPIAGLSPEQEPSALAMTEVVKFAKEHQVKTIFFETLVSSQVAETIAKEIGAKTDVLNPLEGLTEEDQANHLDYIAVMRKNLEVLKAALNE
ncbi:metal ABC transporter substrate-binding protein [Paenibacillus sp.]|jgi:zinc transport system substrate-binding protein|uniref:metal ABC transporter substrate-binding protein n=1 Tax=Paenibacillus sp. TaxID=58172 RepID=UPI00282C643E|nr:metal ABC transporter substrate-binding protein [Paenibacillus sp.]MDR0271279.1 metal ABC transporter substrate-binding protein [Paenibacillus sp.]